MAGLSVYQRCIAALAYRGIPEHEIAVCLRISETDVAGHLSDVDNTGDVPVLQCASPAAYLYWLNGCAHDDPPARVEYPRREFCLDAALEWCVEQRSMGRCHLKEESYASTVYRRRLMLGQEGSNDD